MIPLKIAAFVLALIAVASSQPTEPRGPILDMVLKNALEDLRPKLKDLEIPRQDIALNLTNANMSISLDDGLVKHLDEFVIAKLTTWLIPLKLTNLTITLDKLKLTGRYNLDGNVYLPDLGSYMHIFGNGDAKVELKTIFFTIASDFVFQNGKFQIPPDGLHGFDLYIHESKFNLTNLLGGGSEGSEANSIISIYFPELIQLNKKELGTLITERLRSTINSILKMFGIPKSGYPSSYPVCG